MSPGRKEKTLVLVMMFDKNNVVLQFTTFHHCDMFNPRLTFGASSSSPWAASAGVTLEVTPFG